MVKHSSIDQLTINSIRMLGVQAVNQANSGHPGIVLGAAPMVYALFHHHLKFNPKNPKWFNRDRFILSAGHGSALLYSTLLHAGYNFKIADLKQFRQLNSSTPGHPEYEIEKGVEMATGPLGQGLSTAVGMALAESFLAAKFNQTDAKIIDHYTYVLCSDGDLQEGVSQEALSLAGHWKLNKLIILYDSNQVQLDSDTNLVISDQNKQRFHALNWNYLKVNDGNNYEMISEAIALAKKSDKPTMIEINTIIGYGATKQGTSAVHGAPLQADIETVKKALNWTEPDFTVPSTVINHFQKSCCIKGEKAEGEWDKILAKYAEKYPEQHQIIKTALNGVIGENHELAGIDWTALTNETGAIATRAISGKILKILSSALPTLFGGSADLAGSTKALVYDESYRAQNRSGRHVHFGVREYGMALIVNGLNLHQGLIPFGSTFLVFSDYLKPALRAAALMKINALFIFSHDSIAVGEDGPTHEPIEHLTMLRIIPNFNLIRPCDTRETIGAYQVALTAKDFPNAIILTRQDLPTIATSLIEGVKVGGYIISREQNEKPLDLILIATGSEVHLAINVQTKLLALQNINARVVSMPSTFLFERQNDQYKTEILPEHVRKVAIEMGSPLSWYQYVGTDGLVIGINQFGRSAPMSAVLQEFGFTTDQIYDKIIKYWEKKEKK